MRDRERDEHADQRRLPFLLSAAAAGGAAGKLVVPMARRGACPLADLMKS